MRCGSRSCARCFPPNEVALRALGNLADELDYGTKTTDDVLGWNTDEYWEFHDKAWFQAILQAYNAGIVAARGMVQREIERLTE